MAIITISRGTFSGGKALAERLAERLGYPCLSREEIVPVAARQYGITERDLTEAMDERPPFWQQVQGRRIAYLKCVTAVVLDRVEAGNLIYHGHVGHMVLSAVSHVLRVRVIADMEFRIKAAMERKNLTREAAIAFIVKIDKQREKWARFLYGVAWQDPALYDVLFNLERVSVDGACEAVVHMIGLDDFNPTAKSRKALEDLTVASRVWAALATDPHTRSAQVNVTADSGVVTIGGGAGSQKVIRALAELAARIQGVKEVRTEVGMGADWYW